MLFRRQSQLVVSIRAENPGFHSSDYDIVTDGSVSKFMNECSMNVV